MLLRLLALAAATSLLVACDSTDDQADPDDLPILTVIAQTATGAPAAGLDVFVTYGGLLPSEDDLSADGVASRGGDFQVFAPSPSPARTVSSYGYEIPVTGPVVIRLLDVAGTVQAVLLDAVVEADLYRDVVNFDGYPAGVYRIEVTYGGETITRDVLKSDAADDGQTGLALFLGRTGTDGRLVTSDSTRFPVLFDGSRRYISTDEQGNALGEFLIGRTVGVIVQNETGASDGATVQLNGRGTEASLMLTP